MTRTAPTALPRLAHGLVLGLAWSVCACGGGGGGGGGETPTGEPPPTPAGLVARADGQRAIVVAWDGHLPYVEFDPVPPLAPQEDLPPLVGGRADVSPGNPPTTGDPVPGSRPDPGAGNPPGGGGGVGGRGSSTDAPRLEGAVVEVERALGPDGPFALVTTLADGAQVHRDSGLEPGTLYRYRVRRRHAGVPSADAGPAEATTWIWAPPAAPTDLTAQALGSTLVHLAWADAATTETAYRLERSTAGGPFTPLWTGPPQATLYDDASAVGGTAYAYRLCAENDAGASAWAGPATVTPPAATATKVVLTAPPHSATGTYSVVLSLEGPLVAGQARIEESSSPTFSTLGAFTWASPTYPATLARTGKAPGTYYYRAFVGSPALLSGTISVVVSPSGPVTTEIVARYDNTILRDYWHGPGPRTNMAFPDTSLAIGNDFDVWSESAGWVFYGSLLWFDVIPKIGSASVSRATLRLYPQALAADTWTVYQLRAIAEPWDAGLVSWATRPGWHTTGGSTQAPPVSTVVPYEFDVTAIVQNWASGAWQDLGLMLWDPYYEVPAWTALRMTLFDSLEYYSHPDRRPRLIVEYTP